METKNTLTAEEIKKLRNIDFRKIEGFVDGSALLAKEIGEVARQRGQNLMQKQMLGISHKYFASEGRN